MTINAINTNKPIETAKGGTGAISLTDHGILLGAGTGAITAQALTNGQLLIGSTGNAPVAASLTAGTNITIDGTSVPGAITISAAAPGVLNWSNETGATKQMIVKEGYIANRVAGVLAFTLPAAAAVNDIIAIAGSQNGWTIAQAAGQTIHSTVANTTTGAGGSLASATRYDCVELICIVADTDFAIRSSMGTLTYT